MNADIRMETNLIVLQCLRQGGVEILQSHHSIVARARAWCADVERLKYLLQIVFTNDATNEHQHTNKKGAMSENKQL